MLGGCCHPLREKEQSPNLTGCWEVLLFTGTTATEDTEEVCPSFGLGSDRQVWGPGGWMCRQVVICSIGQSSQCPTSLGT